MSVVFSVPRPATCGQRITPHTPARARIVTTGSKQAGLDPVRRGASVCGLVGLGEDVHGWIPEDWMPGQEGRRSRHLPASVVC